MPDKRNENNENSESPSELDEPIISLIVEFGKEPQEACTLVSKLKAFSQKYHRRILEYAGLPADVCSTLLLLFREKDKTKQSEKTQNQETLTKISSEGETIINGDILTDALETVGNQSLQKAEKTLNESESEFEDVVEKQLEEIMEEVILEEVNEIKSEQEIVRASYDLEEKIPVTEHNHIQEYISLEKDIESKEEMEEVLQHIESSYSEMTPERQEEIMPRYIKLKTFICKDKEVKNLSCEECLISNSIDCPLFKP
ncbi:MAG: hypothetical protein ACETWM_22475 [Candidatus Lokiarchaeia archaeon]